MYDDAHEQSLVEETFHTVDDLEAEAQLNQNLRKSILERSEARPAWVPSRSTHTYVKDAAKRGAQLDKLIPTVPPYIKHTLFLLFFL